MKILVSAVSLCLVVVLLSRGVATKEDPRIVIEEDPYDNLVVVAAGEQPADVGEFLANLHAVIRETSNDLATATDERLSFKRVTIYLSENWDTKNLEPPFNVDEEVYIGAAPRPQLIVSDAHPVINSSLFGQHRLQCGEPGDFIFLTKDFCYPGDVTRGKKIVHEWAKYRWGVFEEHGYEDDPLYPLRLVGGEYNLCTDGNSLEDSSSSLLALSSGDSYNSWKSINKFCDTRNHKDTESRHNNLCRGMSAWEVMNMHDDFARENSTRIQTEIRVKHMRREHIVLLVEYTTSIVKWDYLHDSVLQYLLHDLAWGTKVWLMVFNNQTYTVAETVLSSQRDRLNAANGFRNFVRDNDPGTCRDIQDGIAKAAEALYNSAAAKAHGKIVLITQPPYFRDVESEFFCRAVSLEDLGSFQSGRKVLSVLYTTGAYSNTNIYDIMASNPPGEVKPVMDLGNSADLTVKENLLQILRHFDVASTDNNLLQPVVVENDDCFQFIIDDIQTFPVEGYVAIHHQGATVDEVLLSYGLEDQTIFFGPREDGNSTVLLPVFFPREGTYTLEILGPDVNCSDFVPEVLLKTPSPYLDVLHMGALSELAEPQENSRRTAYSAAVKDNRLLPSSLMRWLGRLGGEQGKGEEQKNEEKEDDEEVVLDLRASASLIDIDMVNDDPVVVTAKVTKGGKPVLGSWVKAVAQCSKNLSDPCTHKFILYDDGNQAPDVIGNDGVYSAYWVLPSRDLVTPPLSYILTVIAQLNQTTTVLQEVDGECCPSIIPASNATILEKDFIVQATLKAKVTTLGNSNRPFIARVSDLVASCTGVNETLAVATLEFTSPFYDTSNAGYAHTVVYYNATSPSVVLGSENQFWNGSRNLKTEVSLKCDSTFLFVVRGTFYNIGNSGDSNRARAFCPCYVPPRHTKDTPVTAIVVGVVVSVVLVGLIVGGVVLCKKKPDVFRFPKRSRKPERVLPQVPQQNEYVPDPVQDNIYGDVQLRGGDDKEDEEYEVAIGR